MSVYPELHGCRVLVVEDELLVAMAVEDLLTEEGCDVLATASTVSEALKRVEADGPALVILDRNLHGERTSEVAVELTRRQIPFVVMTGYVSGISDDPTMVGAPLIAKPWNEAALLSGMRQALVEGRSAER
ncbi:response regulator [Polymorphobacter multimanifer]|uniref:CheY-like chemotaxis protein n=1 Tax=Polymorphobacter multimanifer TaxID=1070431 RepID=A0A841L3C7_9SPHN|nr:response regulator [Polymorphobacter multimanifer]MBB6225931.1 CheY-like chemotaxis protein [Polymorphobacter multimanifer]GGI72865.1 response regulator [Polymorphobacter multimanifer]